MIYNYPEGAKCICGKDLDLKIKDFFDDMEVVLDEWEYAVWDDGGIECECGRTYAVRTKKMSVDIYINEEEEE